MFFYFCLSHTVFYVFKDFLNHIFFKYFFYEFFFGGLAPPASSPVSFNIHEYKLILYHYTLLTCVTVVVRTTTVLTRPHTHSLNTTLQKTRRTHRHTHYDKHGTRQSIIFSLCCSRMQKQRAQKDEVVGGPGLERMHWDALGAGFTQKEPSSSSRTSFSVKPVASTSASMPSTTLHQQPASSCS